jgi:hypothetical protein
MGLKVRPQCRINLGDLRRCRYVKEVEGCCIDRTIKSDYVRNRDKEASDEESREKCSSQSTPDRLAGSFHHRPTLYQYEGSMRLLY